MNKTAIRKVDEAKMLRKTLRSREPNQPLISIIIICDQLRMEKLTRLLESMKEQLLVYPAEVLLLHESNRPLPSPPLPLPVRYLTIPEKQGIPFNRNQGIKAVRGEIIVFIDDDCWVQEKWLTSLVEPLLADDSLLAVTGGTRVPPSNFIGDCIAALGFPGGGSLGFEKVWKVSSAGLTNHLSVGNCALRREVFKQIGYFDESMRSGAEDAEFSFRLEKAGRSVKYVPEAYAYHEARTTWKEFARWQLRRGKANYHLKKKVGNVAGLVKLRLWSANNIIQANRFKLRLPLVLFMLGASFVLQQQGYFLEKLADTAKQ